MSPADHVVVDVGQAWVDAPDGSGSVVAAFSRAAYLRIGSSLLALVAGDVAPGPLHARIDPFPRITPGTQVVLTRPLLRVGNVHALLPTDVWTPEHIAAVDTLGAVHLLRRLVKHTPVMDFESSPDHWSSVRSRLAAADLTAACSLSWGRGRGLTPTGDDVAAGFLLAHSLTGATPRARLEELASGAPTHEISRAFLAWAARGQTIAPIHDLVNAASRGNQPATASALLALERVGHTSGMDMAAGITAALVALAREDDTSAQVHTSR